MSADRTVAIGEYGHGKIRCDGHTDGRRCCSSVTGAFRRGVKSARALAAEAGWTVAVRTQYAPNGFDIRDYCPSHARKTTTVKPKMEVNISFRVSKELRDAATAKAEERQENVSDVLREALQRYVKQK